jgi:hypothetical protein
MDLNSFLNEALKAILGFALAVLTGVVAISTPTIIKAINAWIASHLSCVQQQHALEAVAAVEAKTYSGLKLAPAEKKKLAVADLTAKGVPANAVDGLVEWAVAQQTTSGAFQAMHSNAAARKTLDKMGGR